eukprot:753382-Hanusia_phi.AAC.5
MTLSGTNDFTLFSNSFVRVDAGTDVLESLFAHVKATASKSQSSTCSWGRSSWNNAPAPNPSLLVYSEMTLTLALGIAVERGFERDAAAEFGGLHTI